MRDIKFRAWLKDDKRMVEVRSIDFHEEGNIITVNYNDIFGFALNENEIELMQYTGLKDKNGKEIYEGDIVTYQKFGLNEYMVVKYLSRFAVFNICDLDKQDYEVIGNVYQNPELLEENYE